MDRIFSTRIDNAVYLKINYLSAKLKTSKKAVIERAVDLLGRSQQESADNDLFGQTFGAWKRKEAPEATISAIRNEFNKSMNRNRQ